jgi:TonB family protein
MSHGRCRRSADDFALGVATPSPRLPSRMGTGWVTGGGAVAVHLAVGVVIVATAALAPGGADSAQPPASVRSRPVRLVFLALQGLGGGGGGGGRPAATAPTRLRATGNDGHTALVAHRAIEPVHAALAIPSTVHVVIDPVNSAADDETQLGVPEGAQGLDASAGPGSGSGAGGGFGSGIGDGLGSGVGPGVGEGMGGSVYRIGNGVTPPTVLLQVPPRYTEDAARKGLQGTVTLTAVIGRDGAPRLIRVTRSLDPGLDREAVFAAQQWRFAPGRLADQPVDVAVTILIDFRLH